MNEQYFQVNVERATPACDANCPNLQIDIEDLDYTVDNVDDLPKLRKIRCINDTWCQRLHNTLRNYEDHIKEEIQRVQQPGC